MEMNDYFTNVKNSTEEEESSLLKRLIALKKQLDDDEPKLHSTLNNTKENVTNNKNVISLSKFKYRKVNNHNVHKFLSTKIDNRNFIKNQSKSKQNNLSIKTNNSLTKVCLKSNSLQAAPIKTVISKKKPEIVRNIQNSKEYNLEINEIVKNSHIKKCKTLLKKKDISDVSQTLLNIDKYMSNVQVYLSSSKYVVNKEVVCSSLNNEMSNHAKNVHVNRKFQNQIISNSLLNSNLNNASNSLVPNKKPTNSIKKKHLKKLSGKLSESPLLVKIGSTKLVRQSLFRNKWKINNKQNNIENNLIDRTPLSTLQCPTLNTLLPSYNKTKWTNITNPTLTVKPKLSNSNSTNKLKWTRPSILLVNNVKNNNHPIVPKSDKLILFGKNKIIRQSLISSTQSKTNNYLLKHFSHRFALMRKLQQKSSIPKVKSITNNIERQNILLLKKTVNKSVEIKKNGKKSYSMYSYVNPILRSKTNNNCNLVKTESPAIKIPDLCTINNNKSPQSLKTINNDKNKIQNVSLTNNKSLKSKKMFTKQLCLVFNRFGICSKLDQGKCDKRHYKKFITLCTKYLTGECSKEKCLLSHNIVEEKIPFCKHYLNSVCVQLKCPYLHEYRDKNLPICKHFLHGYCTLGRKCPKKHLNLCPIFETKNKCPHGQKCLYPHIQSEEKNIVDVEINEPRYFEITLSNNEDSNENESIHIVPKRRAPLTDLPSYIPLK